MITIIDARDVHRITSGQVIVDITSIVKEVVENALDAGATVVDVQFKNYGLDAIEVADNGQGIAPEDFESIALKHHTSKLASFAGLEEVDTLGFRGEALSSLCSVGSLGIVTTQQPPVAHSLTFHESGELNGNSVCTRPRGTTVVVSNLFHNLPVRLKDLNKNFKREFNKCVACLQSYALIHTNVKFTVHNVNPRGKKTLVLHSQGLNSLKSNIISIFGSNGLQGLIPLDLALDLNPIKHKLKLSDVNDEYTINVTGFISKIGFGRAANDRQFLFINRRPVSLRQWSKVINDVYKTFSNIQSPVIILDIGIDPRFLDLNVTPDKRTILIHNENLILEELRSRLVKFYDSQDLNLVRGNSIQRSVVVAGDNAQDDNDTLSSIKSEFTYSNEQTLVVSAASQNPKKRKILEEGDEDDDTRVKRVQTDASETEDLDPQAEDSDVEEVYEIEDILELPEQYISDVVPLFGPSGSEPELEEETYEEPVSQRPSKRIQPVQPVIAPRHKLTSIHQLGAFRNGSQQTPVIRTKLNQSTVESIINKRECCDHNHDGEDDEDDDEDGGEEEECGGQDDEQYISPEPDTSEIQMIDYREIGTANLFETTATVSDSFEPLLSITAAPKKELSIDDINNQEESEKFLTLTVSKKDFKEMKIIGQFNLGFILALRIKDGKNDLFILDQHASDEKYNFELLQRDTVMEHQRLVIPQLLELNVIDELLVMDHQDIFIKNGFQLKIDMDAIPGERIQLISLPTSKRVTFDTADFYELVHLIKEQQTQLESVRCSKVRSMFAMRACRKSIMVGKHLSMKQMGKVVSNLGDLDKPWNCPHGRPTMRHLTELEWDSFNDDYSF